MGDEERAIGPVRLDTNEKPGAYTAIGETVLAALGTPSIEAYGEHEARIEGDTGTIVSLRSPYAIASYEPLGPRWEFSGFWSSGRPNLSMLSVTLLGRDKFLDNWQDSESIIVYRDVTAAPVLIDVSYNPSTRVVIKDHFPQHIRLRLKKEGNGWGIMDAESGNDYQEPVPATDRELKRLIQRTESLIGRAKGSLPGMLQKLAKESQQAQPESTRESATVVNAD